MSVIEEPRTQPPNDPVDPHDRFVGHMDSYIDDVEYGDIGRCPSCSFDRADGWVAEGATPPIWLVCVRCGDEWEGHP